jgi:hypothetical protein
MFFGIPSHRYWCRGATITFINYVKQLKEMIKKEQQIKTQASGRLLAEYIKALKIRFRPFRKYHLFTSYTNIVSNDISVSSYGMANAVSVQWTPAPAKTAFTGIKSTVDLFANRAWNWFTLPGLGTKFLQAQMNMTERLGGKCFTHLLKYHPNISDENINIQPVEYSVVGYEMAHRYALKGLCNGIKEMYKGSITVLGNAEIKPYDIAILFDAYNCMSGPIEIEEVTHFFTQQTGWISVVIPKAVVFANEISSTPLLDSILWASIHKISQYSTSVGSAFRSVKDATTEYKDELILAGAVGAAATGAVATYTGVVPVAATAGAAIGVAGIVAAGTAGVDLALGGLMASYRYFVTDEVYSPIKKAYVHAPTPITLIPLVMHGYPLTAGIPSNLPQTRWEAFKGKWLRTMDTISTGFSEALLAANTYGLGVANAYGPDMTTIEKLGIGLTK